MKEEQLRLLIKLEILKAELVQAQARGFDNPVWLGDRCQEIIYGMMNLADELEAVIKAEGE